MVNTTKHSHFSSLSTTDVRPKIDTKYFAENQNQNSSSTPQFKLVSWEDLHIYHPIRRAIHSLSFFSPSPVQAKVLNYQKSNHHLLVQGKAGTGKTAAFTILALQRIALTRNYHRLYSGRTDMEIQPRNAQVLVLAPTREIAGQIKDSFVQLSRYLTPVDTILIPKSSASKNIPLIHESPRNLDRKSSKTKIPQKSNKQVQYLQNIRIHLFVGGTDIQTHLKLCQRRSEIVIGTIGRIHHLIREKKLKLMDIHTVILDEADSLLDLQFKKPLTQIIQKIFASNKSARLLAFTATITPTMNSLFSDIITSSSRRYSNWGSLGASSGKKFHQKMTKNSIKLIEIISPGTSLSGISEYKTNPILPLESFPEFPYSPSPRENSSSKCRWYFPLIPRLLTILQFTEFTQSIIFVSSSNRADALASALYHSFGYSVASLHGNGGVIYGPSGLTNTHFRKNMDSIRPHIVKAMKSLQISILISTDIAARGLDVPLLDLIIHLDSPPSFESLTHRNGRAGRFGKPGISILFVNPSEIENPHPSKPKLESRISELPTLSWPLPTPSTVFQKLLSEKSVFDRAAPQKPIPLPISESPAIPPPLADTSRGKSSPDLFGKKIKHDTRHSLDSSPISSLFSAQRRKSNDIEILERQRTLSGSGSPDPSSKLSYNWRNIKTIGRNSKRKNVQINTNPSSNLNPSTSNRRSFTLSTSKSTPVFGDTVSTDQFSSSVDSSNNSDILIPLETNEMDSPPMDTQNQRPAPVISYHHQSDPSIDELLDDLQPAGFDEKEADPPMQNIMGSYTSMGSESESD